MGGKNQRPDYVFCEYHDSTVNTGSFMVRRGERKYIAYPDYQPMLFNLEEDPWEINNLTTLNSQKTAEMDALLLDIIDYDNMARVFSGWDDLEPKEIQPWTQEDGDLAIAWMNS